MHILTTANIPENKKKAMMERSKFRDHMAAMPLGLATPNWDTEIGLTHGTEEVRIQFLHTPKDFFLK